MSALPKPEFLIEKPFLSIKESVRLCHGSGFDGNDECGNELDPDEAELCPNCLAVETRHYREIEEQRDREEEKLGASQYAHLRYERRQP